MRHRLLRCALLCVLLMGMARAAPAALPDGRQSLRQAGMTRSYLLRVPASLQADSPRVPLVIVPLVIVLHGGGGNGESAERMTGFTALAQREGFIVVYPDGSGRRGDRLLTWNAGHCCGYAMHNRVDDVDFIAALIDTLAARYPVDTRRVYVTGMSNGAMMAHRLGIELSARIAAIAPVVGALFGDEPAPAQPVAVLTINGALDRNVPPAGGAPGGRFSLAWDSVTLPPYSVQGRYWATANGCDAMPKTTDTGSATMTDYACPAGFEVSSYLVKDNGHAWPGGERGSRLGDAPGTAIDATQVIWRFFASHRR